MIALQLPEFLVSLALRGLLIGSVLGLIPLALGLIKGRRNLGIYGFAASVAAGALLSGVFSVIAVCVFGFLILRKQESVSETAGSEPQAGDSKQSGSI